MMLRRAATVLACAASATAVAMAPASAGNATLYAETFSPVTGNVKRYASLKFTANGDKWIVCDLAGDGRRAMGSVYWEDSGGNHIITTSVTTGEADCKSGHYNFAESEKLLLQVWIQDGANGSRKLVTSKTVSAS